jgi:hypothetical protein
LETAIRTSKDCIILCSEQFMHPSGVSLHLFGEMIT